MGSMSCFLSYLERADADLEYTSNKYTRGDLERLSHDHLHWGHGQEHRHNFGSHGEGYGHILLLDIPYIIQPVSIGPGITKTGADAPPLQEGIDEARRGGGKVIWAHNSFGFEDIPNWVTGRVHANNIFDGSARGSYKDTYYRYLNVGLHVPFSTGTDWFIYDFSRAYVTTDRPITPREWLDRLAEGKSFITNGPCSSGPSSNKPVGSVIDLPKPATLTARGRAVGRTRLQANRSRAKRPCRCQGGKPRSRESTSSPPSICRLPIDAPCWLALRTPPPPVKDDPAVAGTGGRNEFGESLFAHTSPIYVKLNGEGVFDSATATELVAQMKSDWEKIQASGRVHRSVAARARRAGLSRGDRRARKTPGRTRQVSRKSDSDPTRAIASPHNRRSRHIRVGPRPCRLALAHQIALGARRRLAMSRIERRPYRRLTDARCLFFSSGIRPLIEVDDFHKAFADHVAVRGRYLSRRAGRAAGHHRAQRRGQDDHDAGDRRHHSGQPRAVVDRRL